MAIKKISANLLGNNAVTAASIAGGAISAADIANNSITAAKLSTSTFAIDSLTVNTSDLVVDTANNRVGIGTAPDTLLHLRSTTGAVLRLARQDGSVVTNDSLGKVEFYTNDVTNTGVAGYIDVIAEGGAAGGAMLFGTGTAGSASEQVRITANGNVGIGTTAPTRHLHISSSGSGIGLIATRTDVSMSVELFQGSSFAVLQALNSGLGLGGSNSNSDVFIDSNGNVGIGTTSPDGKLEVEGSIIFGTGDSILSDNNLRFKSAGDAYIDHNTAGAKLHIRMSNNSSLDIEPIVIESGGTVGIGYNGGTVTGGGILSVNGQGLFRNDGAGYVQGSILLHSGTNDTPSYRGQGIYTYNEGSDVSWYIGTPYTNGDLFTINRQHSTTSWDGAAANTSGTNVSNFFAIKNSGEVGVGTLTPTSPFHVNSTYAGYVSDFVQNGTGGGNHGLRVVSGSGSSYSLIVRANASTVFYVDGAGNYYFSGSNQSDVNKKENIADLTDSALDLIIQLQPKTYNFIGSDIDKAGFIAQEMEQVIPRLVSGNEFDPDAADEDGNNPTGKGIDYMGYTAYLTKAIQELKTELDAAKARITQLEG